MLERLFRSEAAHAGRRRRSMPRRSAQARQPGLLRGPAASPTRSRAGSSSTPCTCCCCSMRLRGRATRPAETAQALFDAYVAALDDALREMGVGDLSVGKKMRKLGEAFYGRVKSYEAAFAALPRRRAAARRWRRTVYAERGRRPRRRRWRPMCWPQRAAPGGASRWSRADGARWPEVAA